MHTVFKYCSALWIIMLLGYPAFTQTDTEFWFAAPEVSERHGDKPIFLRLSTFDIPANILIELPAFKTITPLKIQLPAQSTRTINLTSWIEYLENYPHNTILNKGLHIVSSADITGYYEVYGSVTGVGNNSEIFALKGSRALGLEFLVPMQNIWNNNQSVDAWGSFDLVATEDNTVVSIMPTQNLAGGQQPNKSYEITLQRGQTYSARSLSALGVQHPAGSTVQSTKPIAITYKDDSLLDGMHWDLIGDQLVPVNVLGRDYIAVKISGLSNIDKVFVCATQDDTKIFVQGDTIAVDTINKGQTHVISLLSATVFIHTSHPAYALHVGGFTQELGAALLPPLGCTGSSQVSFTRSNTEDLYIELLTKTGFESGFLINGESQPWLDSAFKDVPGTMGVWKAAKVFCDPGIVPENVPAIIKNIKGDFHLATWNGGPSTGFRYGYFSDFSFFKIKTSQSICPGNSITLDAGFGKSRYEWTSSSFVAPVSTSRYLTVSDSGVYRIKVTKDTCQYLEQVRVLHYPSVYGPLLPSDTAICQGDTLRLASLNPQVAYSWNNGSTSKGIKVTTGGNYILKASNEYGCSLSDTATVAFNPLPKPGIVVEGAFDLFCSDSTVTAQSDKQYYMYRWNTGDTTFAISSPHRYPDQITLQVTDANGCRASTSLEIDCSVYLGLVPNLITPNQDKTNESFFIEFLHEGSWELSIYNRWGSKVFYDGNYNNQWSPQELSNGIYFYLLHHKANQKDVKGWVEILR